MSSEIYFHCRKCPDEKFQSVAALRNHQHTVHPEYYAHVREARKQTAARKAASNRTAKARAASLAKRKTRESVRQLITQATPAVNGNMRVSQLITELHSQQKFLADVISLVTNIEARHKESHHE